MQMQGKNFLGCVYTELKFRLKPRKIFTPFRYEVINGASYPRGNQKWSEVRLFFPLTLAKNTPSFSANISQKSDLTNPSQIPLKISFPPHHLCNDILSTFEAQPAKKRNELSRTQI